MYNAQLISRLPHILNILINISYVSEAQNQTRTLIFDFQI